MDAANPSSPPPLTAVPRHPVSAMRIAMLLLAGAVLGTIVGMVVSYKMPRLYEVRARVEGAEHAGHEPQITQYRAAMVTSANDLDNKRVTTFDKAAAEVRKDVHLEPDRDGVTIRVRYPEPREARAIAAQVASLLDTPAREEELAGKKIQIGPESTENRAKRVDIAMLERLLGEQAVEAGFEGTWGEILLGPGENTALIELAKNEDFSRRLTKLKELAVEVGYYGPPGEPIRAPRWKTALEPLPSKPVSPNVPVVINGFRLLGTAFAGLLIPVLLRWKPHKLRPEPRAPRPAVPRKRPEVENDDPW